MAYIVVVNPAILSTPGTGMPFSGALTATVLIASSMTLLMGLYARLPFAVAPGMGLNAFFAFTIVLQNKVPWQTALGMVFWAGVLFLLVSATPLREQIALAIPPPLRTAAAAGIGLLLTFIGLRNAGLIVGDPATLVRMGTLDHRAAFLLLGILDRRGADAARTTRSRSSRRSSPSPRWRGRSATRSRRRQLVSAPDFSSAFLALDIRGALQARAAAGDCRDPVHRSVRLAVDLHRRRERRRPDRRRGPADQPAPRPDRRRGGDAGVGPRRHVAGHGVRREHRRHPHGRAHRARASVVTALCFVPCFFLAPLAAAVPGYATAAVLILVGVSMFQSIATIDFSSIEDALPAFVTVVLIPLTLSITQGILWGFLLHALLYTVAGRWREVSVTLWLLAALSAGLLLLGH